MRLVLIRLCFVLPPRHRARGPETRVEAISCERLAAAGSEAIWMKARVMVPGGAYGLPGSHGLVEYGPSL